MTGRHAGFCAGFDGPGFANRAGGLGPGRGWGRGRGGPGWGAGRGMGWGPTMGAGWRGWAVPWEPEVGDERSFLKREADALRARLEAISKRIGELEDGD